jgi:outer membrane protein
MGSKLRATVIALVISAGASAAQAQAASTPFKIGYVDTQALMEAAPGRVQAESLLTKEGNVYQKQLETLQDSVQGLITKYQKDQATLTPAVKQTREKAIQDLENELQAKNNQFQAAFQQRQSEVMAPIQDVVRKVLEDIRVEDGYAMILDKTPGQTPIIVADKNLDVTDRVVSRLRATAKPALPAAKAIAPGTPAGVTRPPAKPPTR